MRVYQEARFTLSREFMTGMVDGKVRRVERD